MFQRSIFVLFLSLILAGSALSATAQTPEAITSSEMDDYFSSEMPGIQLAVSRTFGQPDFMGEEGVFSLASPIAGDDGVATSIGFMDVSVYQFDSAENAAAAYEIQKRDATRNLMSVEGPDKVVSTIETLSGIGTKAHRTQQIMVMPWSISNQETVTILRDAYLVSVSIMGDSFSTTGEAEVELPVPTLPTLDVATAIAMDGASSTNEMVFAKDGTSTGGLWDFMPAEGDALLQGLVPFDDWMIYPVPAWQMGQYVDLTELPGIQNAVSRTFGGPHAYLSDAAMTAQATPWIEAELTPSYGFIDVMVHQFDRSESATVAFEVQTINLMDQFSLASESGNVTVSRETIPDVGTQAVRIRQDLTQEGGSMSTEFVVIQRGEYIITVSIMATASSEITDTPASAEELPTLEVATTIAIDGEPSADEVVFAEDGTSTGGLWGFMPADDSGILQELEMRSMRDMDLFPPPAP